MLDAQSSLRLISETEGTGLSYRLHNRYAAIGELAEFERSELIGYFGEIKLPDLLVNGCLCIAGGVNKDSVFERLQLFYDGRADGFLF